jgi:hypothetical protein
MTVFRRDFLKLAASGTAGAATAAVITPGARGQPAPMPAAGAAFVFDVTRFGAKGDGVTIDTPAINKAIEAANASGGGTVRLRSGTTGVGNKAIALKNCRNVVCATSPSSRAATSGCCSPASTTSPSTTSASTPTATAWTSTAARTSTSPTAPSTRRGTTASAPSRATRWATTRPPRT